MKKDLFIIELLTSFPFKVFFILLLIIAIGVTVSKCKEKKVQQMKEDVLYIQPKSKV